MDKREQSYCTKHTHTPLLDGQNMDTNLMMENNRIYLNKIIGEMCHRSGSLLKIMRREKTTQSKEEINSTESLVQMQLRLLHMESSNFVDAPL